MPWVKLHDGFDENPKIDGLSDGAFRLYVTGLCYCARALSDGHITERRLFRLFPNGGRAADELVAAGLWHETDGGWQINDYLEFQPSKAEVEEKRKKYAERASRAAQARWGDDANKQCLQASPKHVLASNAPSRPVPIDLPTEDLSPSLGFAEFWSEYPRKVGKRTAQDAYRSACKRATPEHILAGLRALLPGWARREPQHIPHPTTWLRRDGWDDEPDRTTTTTNTSLNNLKQLPGSTL